MKLYENVFIARSDLLEDDVEKFGEKVREIITSHGSEVVAYKYCGIRNLVYDICNNNKGHFYLTHFLANSDLLSELDTFMKLNEDIIRHITVAIPESNTDLQEILIKEKKEFE